MAEQENGKETRAFEAEVGKLLDIVVHSLYSEKEIFLRELISNASDACDRLRYAAVTEPGLTADDPEFRVVVSADKKARTLTISDNGVGMNHDDLVSELGTIARSGTHAFVEHLTGDAAKDMSLIGQFGVGFYSSFMVAREVAVISRRAGEDHAWRWHSEGTGAFTIEPAEKAGRGTEITLRLRKEALDFLEPERLRHVIKTYSDHISLPIQMAGDGEPETVNAASALWTRPRRAITDEQYGEFYHHVGNLFDKPWMTLHNRVEGKLDYTSLLFIPSTKPFDLFHPERKHAIKLYVKRVYITDDCEELIPPYLRFLRGIVDSEDLPLNISREMLQNNPLLARIRTGLVKRVLGELEKKATKKPDEYATFWENFGALLKEGIYEDQANRDRLLELARFHTTAGDGPVSLAAYRQRMKEGQEAIYYIAGDALDTLRKSPQIEGFAARGVEVLLMTDPVDEFWMGATGAYQETPFKSATKGSADLAKIAAEAGRDDGGEAVPQGQIDRLIAMVKLTLGEAIHDVRVSERLTDSPVCLVADDHGLDMHLERLLKQHNQVGELSKRILEINPRHALIKALAAQAEGEGAAGRLADTAHLLLDQARIVEGEPVPDPAAFSRRLAAIMTKSVGGQSEELP